MVEHHVAPNTPAQARAPAQGGVDVGGAHHTLGDKVVKQTSQLRASTSESDPKRKCQLRSGERQSQFVTSPARLAAAAACVRFTTPSTLKMAVMCDLVVFSERSSARLISLFVRPRHSCRSTSVCRSVSLSPAS